MKRIVATLLLGLLLAPLSLRGQEEDLVEREGFLIGLGPLAGYEAANLERFGGGIELRIGGAFNETMLLYYESASFFTGKNSDEITQFDMQAKFQFFFAGDNYFNVGAGTSGGETCQNNACALSDIGLVTSAGIGHEFRLTNRFALSPEIGFAYRRLEGIDNVQTSLLLHCGWYF